MTLLLEKRADTIEAFQFTGGHENAQEVIEWVLARDRQIVISWTPEVLNDGEVVIPEALYVIVQPHANYSRSGDRNKTFRLRKQDWIVLDKKKRDTYPAQGYDLFKEYKEIEDDSTAG